MNTEKKLYIISGEISGDTHGSELIGGLKAQQPSLEFAGAGGPMMRAEGGKLIRDWVDEAAVLGLVEVLKKYGWFREQFDEMLTEIIDWQPDAVILIDYPGFNLRMAKALKKAAPAIKIIYYISPQVWAWNRGRIPKMAKVLDLMLCIFPFEKKLYEDSGLKTEFIGHPLIDELADIERFDREENLVGLFPGSRSREIAKLFPMMLGVAKRISREKPEVRFVTPAVSEKLASEMRLLLEAEEDLPEIEITVGNFRELLQRCTVGVITSGTATMEAACLGIPYCLVYKVAWGTYVVGKAVIRVDYLGIANILAGREIIKEFLQNKATPEAVSAELLRLLDEPEARHKVAHDLEQVVARLGDRGTHDRAAISILKALEL